jgi:hypothetical protein
VLVYDRGRNTFRLAKGPFVTWWREWIKETRLYPQARRKRQKVLAKSDRAYLVKRILEEAAIVEAEGDADGMHKCSYKLLRLGLYERGWELFVRAAELTQPSPIPEWEGGDLANRSILIRAHPLWHSIGEELRLARFIAPAARHARHCIVLGEMRLVPLLRRSFRGVDVRPRDIDDAAAFAHADVAAYYETVAYHYGKTAEEIRRFAPLRADLVRVKSIRRRYELNSHGPLIGISWWSSNESKLLPDLQSWAPLLAWTSPTFVSLQYGDIERDVEVLRGLAGGRVIHDTEIDQLIDLDSVAAQIAALDAVVSISNTTIDMAGMLKVPTVHIRDDKSSRYWPRSGPSPWYPDMTFLYRQQRPWAEVFAEARTSLEQLQLMSTARR